MNLPLRFIAVSVALLSSLALAQAPQAPGGERRIEPRVPGAAGNALRNNLPEAPPSRRPVAQRPPGPGRPADPAAPTPPAAQPEAPATPAEQAAANAAKTCMEIARKARFNPYFDKVEIEKLIQTVSDATCKTFIIGENIRGKISIIGPENGKVSLTADQFYAAFLAALDSNNLAVYPHGRFLKIVEKNNARKYPIPTITDPDQPYTTNEQMITRIFRLRYVEVEAVRGVVQQMTSTGDVIPFQPDILIVNDVGSNMHRIEKIIDQLDNRASSDEIRVIQLQYAGAQEIADKVQKLFESKGNRPGQRPGGAPAAAAAAPPPAGSVPAAGGGEARGPATLSQIIPDERTNKLIVIASPSAMERILSLIREIDVPISGEGRINVYYLENANAEEVANTLQSLSQGSSNRPARPPTPVGTPPGTAAAAATRGPVQAAELFSGEVKVSADKSTNSLVIIASQNDYRSLVRVIEKLDIPRRQVFVEAVIMEVNADRSTKFGAHLHGGIPLGSQVGSPLLLASKPIASPGLPLSLSVANLAQFGGFLAGLQGPAVPGLGIELPSFGLLLHALQESSDVNVLSTPHILTSDNEEAEITVGSNVPFQAGFSPSNLGATGLGGLAGATQAQSLLGGLGGLGSFFAPITRQNVELKLTVKPQINESDFVRLVINEQTEEIASENAVLGPTTNKRSAKTTVVARDQETVVIGGIMQDRTVESVTKIPLLGDIPIIGHLFREESKRKVKTNLLLFLTPYIIRDQSDFRRIFERKVKERQQFVEQFYGAVPGYEAAIDFSRKQGPFAKMTRALDKELNKIEHGGPGSGEKLISPGSMRPGVESYEQSGPTPSVPPGEVPPPPPVASPPGSDAAAGPEGMPVVEPPPSDDQLKVQPGGDELR